MFMRFFSNLIGSMNCPLPLCSSLSSACPSLNRIFSALRHFSTTWSESSPKNYRRRKQGTVEINQMFARGREPFFNDYSV